MKKLFLLTFSLLLLGVFNVIDAYSFKADDVVGVWFNEEKDAKIKIYKKNGKYHGKLVWLKEPNRRGKPKVDDNNPNPKKQKRPIMGLVIMTHFVWDGDDVWEDGNIYDPKSGKTYSCKMTLSEDKKVLEVRGYVGVSLFGRTSTWTKAE